MPYGFSKFRQFATAIAVGLATLLITIPQTKADENITGVVELFTSQGCSSCPPADEYLGVLAKQKGILALTLPVDYWDFLGWKDTLASPAYTKRQRAYAASRKDRNVYTPQMVINGRVHAIGSYRDEVQAALKSTQGDFDAMRVDIDLEVVGNQLKIKVGDGKETDEPIKDATVWLALYSRVEKVSIGRGENTGREITYYNVVRELVPIGMWSGKAKSFSLPRKDILQPDYDGCAVIIQAGDTGPIYGVAAIENWPES